MAENGPRDVTALLQNWRHGDERALEELMPLVYDELHRLAHRYMVRERAAGTLQTSALVNEAYLRLIDARRVPWQDRVHFFAVSSNLMRRILVDFARKRGYKKRGGGAAKVESLLACDGWAECFIDQPAMEVAAQVMAQDQGDTSFESRIGWSMAHYRIIEKIGEGGMGIVYRAEDTKLHRQVAVKVLPELFSGDSDRLARFEREARLLASLNRPNIAVIYGFDQADREHFLVMELVAGETLAQRISRRSLPMDEVLAVCHQIAEGLEAAHEKGIIHRDLKPANIKITPEGKVKILDFGLAKGLQEQTVNPDQTYSPTLTEQMTRSGIILGTAAYMSPEQAKGKVVDKRTDIWAFGCILFECLTGKRAFPGETMSDILAAVIKEEPAWAALPHGTPEKVRDLLKRCLRKDPERRLRDIGDARLEIDESRSPALTPDSRTVLHHRRIIAAAGIAVVSIILIVTGWLFLSRSRLAKEARLKAPEKFITSRRMEAAADYSPDGQSIAFHSTRSGSEEIWICSADGSNPRQLTSMNGPQTSNARWSPDGKTIVFDSRKEGSADLYLINPDGSSQRQLTSDPGYEGHASWSRDGKWIYFCSNRTGQRET